MYLAALVAVTALSAVDACRLAVEPCRDTFNVGEPALIRISIINPSSEDVIVKGPFSEGRPPHVIVESPEGQRYHATSGLYDYGDIQNLPWALRADSTVSTFFMLSVKTDRKRKVTPAFTEPGDWKVLASYDIEGQSVKGETIVSVVGNANDVEKVRETIQQIERSRWELHTKLSQSAIDDWQKGNDDPTTYRALRDLFRASSNAVSLRVIPATKEELIAHLACDHTMCRDFVLQQLAGPLIDKGATAEARRVLDAVSVPTVESGRRYGRIELRERKKRRLEGGK